MKFFNFCGTALAFCLVMNVAASHAQPGVPPWLPKPGALPGGLNMQVSKVEVRDVAFGTPGINAVKVGRMVFTGFVRSGERVRAERIDLENIVAQSGTRTTKIPAIVISGADLPTPLHRALTEGAAADDWAGLLAQASMDRISIDHIAQSDPAMKFEATLKGFVVNGIKGGLVASARLASAITSAAPGDAADKVVMQLGEVRYQGIDLAEAVRFFTGGGDGRAKRLLQRVVADGIDVTAGDTAIHWDRFELSGVDGAAPKSALPAGLSIEAMLAQAGGDPKLRQQLLTSLTEMLRDFRVNRYSLEGLTVSVPQQATFSLGAITLSGLSGRGIDRIEFTGIDFPEPDTPLRLDRFEIEKITYGALLDAALAAAASGQELDLAPAKLAEIVPRIAGLKLVGLNFGTPQGPVALAELRMDIDDFSGALPEKFAVAINGLKLALDQMEASEGRDKLLALGFNEVVASAQAQIRWLPREQAMLIENTGFTLDKAGRVELLVRLDNVDLTKAMADPAAAERLLGEARIESVQIRLANFGFAERFYADVAKTAGISADAVKAGLAAEMRNQAVANFGPLLAPGSADAIAKFLQAPGRITLVASPRSGQSPLTLADVQSLPPPALMERITIKIETAPN